MGQVLLCAGGGRLHSSSELVVHWLRTRRARRVSSRQLVGDNVRVPRKKSRSARTTLYRVRGITDLSDAIRSKYIAPGDFSVNSTTYGMGFQLLEPTHIDSGFGMRVAIRAARPDAIQSLTRSELDHRSRTDRSSIPAGEALRGFGIGDFGEVVTRISGTATLTGLAAGDTSVRIPGPRPSM